MSDYMMAVSLWQPWASLIFAGRKKFETRRHHYPLGYHNGRIAIHAAKKRLPLKMITEKLNEICYEEFGCSWNETLPYGAVLGTVRLTGCYGTDHQDIHKADDDEKAVGDWGPGRFCWELSDVKALNGQLPFKGAQGFFRVPHWLVAP